MVWLTLVRSAATFWLALTLFAAFATEFIAALLGFNPSLGSPGLSWYGLPLYDPWDFLRWSFDGDRAQPWSALLGVVLTGVIALAAFAALVFAVGMAPLSWPTFRWRRGFERWDILGQRGLLAANGLALGAVRRHVLAKPDIVSLTRGNSLIVGDPAYTDDALLAALSRWQGALVFVDARGISAKLPRAEVIRFAPGRHDSACYDPLLALRGGDYAWADAKRLASAFLQSCDSGLVNNFALLMLDQLLTAPLEERTLAALHRRLADPRRLLDDLCVPWSGDPAANDPPLCEMARVARVAAATPHATLAAIAHIDAALGLFADGAYAIATSAHQFRFADLVAGDGPATLVIAPPPGEAERAAPQIAAMLAQLVAECASAADQDHLGRRKKRNLLIVIETEACRALSGTRSQSRAQLPLVPLHASANNCHMLLQAGCVNEAARFTLGGIETLDAIAAIGPQTELSAAALSSHGGAVRHWRRAKRHREAWKEWLLPAWGQASRPVVADDDLRGAPATRAHIFIKHLRPIRASMLSGGEGRAQFASPTTLLPPQHDWSAPPLPRPQALAGEASTLTTNTRPIGAQIRKELNRSAPPRSTGAKTP
jgi:type IV secretion system protein VirD4